MGQTLMAQLVDYENECCIYGYFMKRKDMPLKAIAAHLGVSYNTVRLWKRRIESGEVSCGYGASGKGLCRFKCGNTHQNMP